MNLIRQRARPEINAGGFSRYEGVIQFFTRVQALIQSEFIVLDFGAGRGLFQDDENPFRRNLRTLKGKVRKVVGVDIDAAVLTNQGVDETLLIEPGKPLPFADGSFDLVLSEWTIEHLDDPDSFSREMRRVVKSGGWLCARTPNKWGLTALGATLIPNAFHVKVLGCLQSTRQDKDVFPTRYKLNTLAALNHHFPRDQWLNYSYLWRGEPKYFGNNAFLFYAMQAWNWLVPPFMATDIFIFLKRR